jgi:rod shape determining protein RodA
VTRPPAALRRARTLLFLSAWGLTAIGILFVHSATADGESFPSQSARMQCIKAGVGLVACVVAAHLSYRHLDRWAYAIYWLLVAVLAGMLLVKTPGGGHNRFIELRGFNIQPSEIMKVGLILALARYLRYREDQRQVVGLVRPFAIMLLPMALVLLQPNLGLSLMFPPVLVAMLFVAGSRPRHLATAGLTGIVLLAGAYFLSDHLPLLHDYQRRRIQGFFDLGSAGDLHEGFQRQQSLIAVSTGGLTGKGYLQGTQNTTDFLPEEETDFIFGIIAEEKGFAGALVVIALFVALVGSTLRVAVHTREPFGRLVAVGIAVAFGAQAVQNIGMTLGLTPITGIALPFVSLAGSNLVIGHLAVGIVAAIASQRVPVVATRDLDPEDRPRALPVFDARPAGLLESRGDRQRC